MRVHLLIVLSAVALFATGCAHYAAPAPPANFERLGLTPDQVDDASDLGVVREFNRQPLATFPASIAIARVQSSRYSAPIRWQPESVATDIAVLNDSKATTLFKSLVELPGVGGVAPLNPLVLPNGLTTAPHIRRCAATVRAEMVLLYTVETNDRGEQHFPFWNVLTLGVLPTYQAKIVSTASAVLMDTRSGYVYALAQGSADSMRLASPWAQAQASRKAQDVAEAQALEHLVKQFEQVWPSVVARFRDGQLPGQPS